MQVYEGTDAAEDIDQVALGLDDHVLIQAKGGEDVIRLNRASVEPGSGNDTVIGQSRWSTVAYWDAPAPVTVDLKLGQAQDGWGTVDTLVNIRTVQGSTYGDHLLGSDSSDVFWVDEGDVIDGRDGNDELVIWQPESGWSWDVAAKGVLELRSEVGAPVVAAQNVELLRFQDASFYLPGATHTAVEPILTEDLGLPDWAAYIFKVFDANNDGLMDFVFAPGTFPPEEAVAFTPRLYLQARAGGFYEASVSGDQRGLVHPRDFAAGDFNGDGVSDVVFVGHGYDTMPFPGERSVLWLGDGRGGWVDQSDWLPNEEAFTHSVAVADVNRDGFDDIYLGNIWGVNVLPPKLLLGGQHGFVDAWLPELAGSLALTDAGALPVGSLLSDLNGDGYVDLVAGEGQAGTMLFWGVDGSQTGRWFDSTPTRLPSGVFGDGGQTITVNIVAADVNGDDQLDLLLSQTRGAPFYESRAIQILIQDDQGQFQDQTQERFVGFDQDAEWITFLQATDLNGDGFVDILAGTQDALADGAIAWINNGHGVFYAANGQNGFPAVFAGVPIFDQPGAYMAAHIQPGGELTVTQLSYDLSSDVRISGGFGIDSIRIEGRVSDYHLDLSSEEARLWAKQSSHEFPRVFNDIERLLFNDASLALDIDGNAGQAYRLYKAAFDRIPDQTGLGFWIAQMDAGVSLAQAASGFVSSTEFESMYGDGVADAGFIDLLYENVLDRQPDASGYAYWLDAMNNGLTREQVLAAFSESAENKVNVADLIADGILYSPFLA